MLCLRAYHQQASDSAGENADFQVDQAEHTGDLAGDRQDEELFDRARVLPGRSSSVYKISDKQYAIEEGDNIAFVRDGGGDIQLFAGDEGAMKTSDPDAGPHTATKAEYVVLEVRAHPHRHEIPDSVADEGIQLTGELRERYR